MEPSLLAVRVYAEPGLSVMSAKNVFSADLDGLDVTMEITVSGDGWIQVGCVGEDADFAVNFLKSRYGTPVGQALSGNVYSGYVKTIGESGLIVDVGTDLEIPAVNLRSLGPGNAIQVATRFGLIPRFPVKVLVQANGRPELAEETTALLWKWKKSPSDRVIINASTRSRIKSAIRKTGHGRDILGIERIGILEHAIICKTGTDGPGIVAEIGPLLKADIGVIRGDG